MLSSADFQLTMNSADALVDAPFDEAFLGREVEDVEAVDPRREDHDRRLQHLVGRRRVLDQLVERRLLDHLARRRREVAPDLEHAGLGLRQLPRRNVLQHVGEALEQILAARLERPLEHLRVGQREVGRAHRVDEAARREAQLLARRRRRRPRSRRPCRAAGRTPANRSGGWCRRSGSRAIRARRSGGPCAPSRRGRRRGHPAEHLAPGLEPLGPGLRAGAHQRHRVGRGALRRRSRTRAAIQAGNGWSFFRLLGPEFHQHLLGAAHHQRPMLPVLERRDRACRCSCRPPSTLCRPHAGRHESQPLLVCPRLFRHCRVRRVRRAARRREAPDASSPSSSSRSSTGVGGGTLRDLLIGAPVFWVHTNGTLLICIARRWSSGSPATAASPGRRCCGSTPPAWPPMRPMARPRRWLRRRAGPRLRDGRADRLRRRHHPRRACRRAVDPDAPELYVTAAALAAGLFVGLSLLGIGVWPAAAIADRSPASRCARAAIARGWSLPAYRGLGSRSCDRSLLCLLLAACATVPTREPPRAREVGVAFDSQRRDRELRRGHSPTRIAAAASPPTIRSASPRSARWSTASAS